MNILSKVGQRDNVVTYEHICDTRADMSKIEPRYITLGSTCIVLQGESGMEVYMADSGKEWHDLLLSSGNNQASGLVIHVCAQNEVSNGKPNVEFPLETELYLVPARESSGNLYDEYVYVNGEWELFGGAPVSLTGYATEAWVSQQGYLTSHQNIPVQDVQVDDVSILNNGIAAIPRATSSNFGVVKLGPGFLVGTENALTLYDPTDEQIKNGYNLRAIKPNIQHKATFYGLAKAAGDTTQAQSDNAVGTYTDSAKSAIQQMLGINTAIATAIGNIHSFDVQVVQALPTQDIETHTIYFVPKTEATNDVYDEYLYINNQWEMIGNTQVDLTNYATQTYVNNSLAAADTLPTPNEDGIGLVSINGEWVQQPGYGYSVTEDSFVFSEFTSTDFTQQDTEYVATIPLTQELLSLAQRMFMEREEFNVTIDGTTYNSISDQFTYTNTPSIYLQNVFTFEPNLNYTEMNFLVPAIPSSVKIYGSVTTYTPFDYHLLPSSENDVNIGNGTGQSAVFINGSDNDASGLNALAAGYHTTASNYEAHAEGRETVASGEQSHAEGRLTTASGRSSHAEGYGTIASDQASHAEGWETRAERQTSHAEGTRTGSFGLGSHAEGYGTVSLSWGSHSEGQSIGDYAGEVITITSAENATEFTYEGNSDSSFAQSIVGMFFCLKLSQNKAYAFRIIEADNENKTIQISNTNHPAFDHIEAILTDNIAYGESAHSEGKGSQALAYISHAEGWGTIASAEYQHVQGRYNIEDTNRTYAHIVGNGTSSARSNAHTLDWNGNAWYAGKVTAGTVNSPANPTAANDLTTKQYVDNALAAKVVTVTGTTPTITAAADTQYICGEVSTLSFTPSATGINDIIFESGSTATVLTVPNTVKFPEWFDATALEPNMVYEISIMNGTYGAVMAWATT